MREREREDFGGEEEKGCSLQGRRSGQNRKFGRKESGYFQTAANWDPRPTRGRDT